MSGAHFHGQIEKWQGMSQSGALFISHDLWSVREDERVCRMKRVLPPSSHGAISACFPPKKEGNWEEKRPMTGN